MTGRARLLSPGPRARTPITSTGLRNDLPVVGVPVRTCVGCRRRDLRSVLLRLVVDLAGGPREVSPLVVDAGRSLPGRGAWLHASPRCLELAERRRAFPRALRIAGSVDLAEVRALLEIPDMGQAPSRPSVILGRTASNVDKESGLEADGHPMSPLR